MLNEPFTSFQIKNQRVIIVDNFQLTQVIIHVFTYYMVSLYGEHVRLECGRSWVQAQSG